MFTSLIIEILFQHFHNLNYNPNEANHPQLTSRTRSALTKLLNQVKADSNKPESFVLAKGGVLGTPPNVPVSQAIRYGFKAPVAMTLLPFWQALEPKLKFLHVVRDGRDIAFSANQVVRQLMGSTYIYILEISRLLEHIYACSSVP